MSPKGVILFVGAQDGSRSDLREALERADYLVDQVSGGKEAMARDAGESYNLILADLSAVGTPDVQLIQELRARWPHALIVALSQTGDSQQAVTAIKAGASDYVVGPVEAKTILALVEKAAQIEAGRSELPGRDYPFGRIVGQSSGIKEVFSLIEKVADTDSTVLATGESGTGKELVARAIHFSSRRREKSLVPVNCGAIPEELLESELFGHEKGALPTPSAPVSGASNWPTREPSSWTKWGR